MNRIPHTLVTLGTMVFIGLHGAPLRAQPVVISDLVEAKARVELVDQKTREVLLRGDNGELETIVASPEVRNLAQTPRRLCPGQCASIRCTGDEQGGLCTGHGCQVAVAGRATPGSMPGAFRVETIHARVQIQGIDLANKTVSLRGTGAHSPGACRSTTPGCSTSCERCTKATRLT